MSGQSTDSDVASPQTAAHPAPVALKVCPFCSAPAHTEANPDFGAGSAWLLHASCGPDCKVQPSVYGETEAEVIVAWNSRPGTDELVAALKAAKRDLWSGARTFWTLEDFNGWAVVQQIDAALAKHESR